MLLVALKVAVSIFATLLLSGGNSYAQNGMQCPDPTPVEVVVVAVPIVVASTTDEYFVLYVQHDLDTDTSVYMPVSVTLGEAGTTMLAENVEALPKERYRVEKYLVADPADVDGDCIDDITELADPAGMNPVNSASTAEIISSLVIPDQETFDALAFVGPRGKAYIKFIIVGMDTEGPRLFFMDTYLFENHPVVLNIDIAEWNSRILGEITYDPELVTSDGSSAVYHYSLGNRYSFSQAARIYTLLAASMPLLEDNLAFWIESHALLRIQSDLPLYRASRMNILFDEDIFPETSFLALNQGEGYGLLRVMSPNKRPHPRDIVIYETLPNELPRVAGIISTVPQTPLSHVNLRAVQAAAPNAFIPGALDDVNIDDLINTHVYYKVTEGGYEIRAATLEEVNSHYDSSRPPQGQTPQRNLSVTPITPLSQIGFGHWTAFGVKAANVAVLGTLGFPEGTVPYGFAIPFYFYDEFMKHNDFYSRIDTMLANPDFQTDFEVQDDMLDDLRDDIEDAETPGWITEAIEEMNEAFDEDINRRYRSSTNNEDLPGFNGAGLYDSKSQKPIEDEEDLAKSLKEVYASLWNFRAFTEREFHRIDHKAAAMGVLVHPSYRNELVNGVAVSSDPAYDTTGTYYVNSQIGEDLVTNPEAHSVPEELLLNLDGTHIVVATSNQVPPGQLLMSNDQLDQLRRHLTVIHNKFAELYEVEPDEQFAMEIEFKITSDNVLAIKQARPRVFAGAHLSQPPITTVPQSPPITTVPQSPPITAVPQSPPITTVPQSPPITAMPQSPPPTTGPQPPPTTGPQPPPITAPPDERLGTDAGGCAIADTENTPKSAVFNLFPVIFVLFCFLQSHLTRLSA